MQSKNELLEEVEKNKNNVFMSEDLKDLVDNLDSPASISQKSAFNAILEFDSSDILKIKLFKLKTKKDKLVLSFIDNENLTNVFLNNKIKKIFIESRDDIVLEQEILHSDINYTIKLVDNNIYKYKIKIVRNKDGI